MFFSKKRHDRTAEFKYANRDLTYCKIPFVNSMWGWSVQLPPDLIINLGSASTSLHVFHFFYLFKGIIKPSTFS